MASALLRFKSSSTAGQGANCSLLYDCCFFGGDVDPSVDGQFYELQVVLAADFTLGDLKSAVGTAVGAKATELGLSVSVSNVNIPTFEHAPPP